MKIKVNVIPNSSRNEIVGWQGDTLKIKVKAPADKGKANKELINILAKKFNVKKGQINIKSGHKIRTKLILININ